MNTKKQEDDMQKIKMLLLVALEKIYVYLDAQDVQDVRDYIKHGEYGVGWELLWDVTNKRDLNIPDELVSCGKEMGFDVS